MGTVHLHPSAPAHEPTIAHLAEQLDARRYRCPPALERRIDLLLETDGPLRILLLTGRGGLGKSAALREVARRARQRGIDPALLDGRVQDVAAAVDAMAARRPGLLLVEGVDELGVGMAALGAALAGLPEQTRVVLAGRRLPGRWLPDALDPIAARVRLEPMPREEAEALLERYDVTDPGVRAAIVSWAKGLPLALVVGARVWSGAAGAGDVGASVAGAGTDIRAALVREGGEDLLAHLADAALEDLDPDLLDALVVAPGVDLRLLTELFPGRVPALVEALRSCTVVEPAGERLLLHPTVAAVLLDRLRAEEPGRAAAAVLRTAAHEHRRAVAGEAAALTRLAALVEDPALRAAMGPTVGVGHYADRWRPADAAAVRSGLHEVHPQTWDLVRPWREDARVVRRADGRPVAVVAALPLASADALEGPRRRLVAPVVRFARAHGLDDRAVLSAFQITFDGGAGGAEEEVAWVRNAAALARCGVGNPRIDLVNVLGANPAEGDVLRGWGYTEIEALSRVADGVPVATWVADAGPGGLAGMLYAAVVREQGVPGDASSGDALADGILLAALEVFHSDASLLALPIAPRGSGAGEGAEQLRARIRSRVASVLAEHPALLDLVDARYLAPGGTHESAMRATYLSRATYFRRLRRARELLSAPPPGPSTGG